MSLMAPAGQPDPIAARSAEAFAVVVLGGGPAGALCAMRLASHGVRTLLVDKATFPRGKVCGCCLNLSAVAALQRSGLSDLPQRLGAVPLHQWSAWMRGRCVRCPLPGGWSLSRATMDAELLSEAAAAGAVIQTGTAGTIAHVDEDGVWIALRRGDASGGLVRAQVAVVATGLAGGGVERWLPWQQTPSGPLGAGVVLSCPDGGWQRGVIYMACGDDGYVGAVVLEDGQLDLAAALRAPPQRRQPRTWVGRRLANRHPPRRHPLTLGQRMHAVLQQAGLSGAAGLQQAAVSATPRLQRKRRVGHGPLIAIGDAAGYIEPFTGEGMAWAMHSGLTAADCIAAALPNDAGSVGRRWAVQHRRLLRWRQLPCRTLAALLQHDLGRSVLLGSIRRAPWLTPSVVRYLNRP